MADESRDVTTSTAFARTARIRELLQGTTKHLIEIGFEVLDMDTSKGWKSLGYNPLEDWWFQAFRLKRSRMYQHMSVAKVFGPLLTMAAEKFSAILECDHTKLTNLAPLVKDEEESKIEEMIHAAKSLGGRDFEDLLRTMKGKPSQVDCDHAETEELIKCKACGKVIK